MKDEIIHVPCASFVKDAFISLHSITGKSAIDGTLYFELHLAFRRGQDAIPVRYDAINKKFDTLTMLRVLFDATILTKKQYEHFTADIEKHT